MLLVILVLTLLSLGISVANHIRGGERELRMLSQGADGVEALDRVGRCIESSGKAQLELARRIDAAKPAAKMERR